MRHGVPFPYLFILAFDVLSRLITCAHENNNFCGIKLAASTSALTYLFFVDDAIIFSKDSPEDIYNVVSILNSFTTASGQKINTAKSGIIFGNKIMCTLKARMTEMTPIPIWDNPVNYLGIPAD